MRAIRRDRGLTQKEMASRLGLSQNHYATLERGDNPTPLRTLLAFARETGASEEWLRGGMAAPAAGAGRSDVDGSGAGMTVREGAAEYRAAPADWAMRLAALIEEDRDKIEYALRELGLGLPELLARLGKRITEEGGGE